MMYVQNKISIKPTNKTISMWSKTPVKPLGTARVVLKNLVNGRKYATEYVVVKQNLTLKIEMKVSKKS